MTYARARTPTRTFGYARVRHYYYYYYHYPVNMMTTTAATSPRKTYIHTHIYEYTDHSNMRIAAYPDIRTRVCASVCVRAHVRAISHDDDDDDDTCL